MVYEERDGKLSRISDRAGHVWAELAWNGPVLTELRAGTATVHFEDRPHPLLGRAHAISGPGGQPLTEMSAVDWARPGRIPAIAAPGRLPPGVGAVILNVLAVLAVRARVPALRYAGPYPTHALYRALLRSFHTTATEAAFVDDALARAAHLATDELPLEFVPAPHECLVVPGGHVELRDGLERAVLDGISYEPQGSPARLIDHRAELWFGDAPWAHVATFAPDGSLLGGPHPIPACTSDVIGRAFPGALRTAMFQDSNAPLESAWSSRSSAINASGRASLGAIAPASFTAVSARLPLRVCTAAFASKSRASRFRGLFTSQPSTSRSTASHSLASTSKALARANCTSVASGRVARATRPLTRSLPFEFSALESCSGALSWGRRRITAAPIPAVMIASAPTIIGSGDFFEGPLTFARFGGGGTGAAG